MSLNSNQFAQGVNVGFCDRNTCCFNPIPVVVNNAQTDAIGVGVAVKLADVKLNTIIVIDDIYTTGSTIDTISTICRASGCEKIYFLTVAIGRGF